MTFPPLPADGQTPWGDQFRQWAQSIETGLGYTIIGPGRPDIPGTMLPIVAESVENAHPGTVFRSTDGPQGAWEWQKRGSRWVVTQGDTGWRMMVSWSSDGTVSGSMPANSRPADGSSGFIRLRRVGGRVYHLIRSLVAEGSVSWSLPIGFAPDYIVQATAIVLSSGAETARGIAVRSTAITFGNYSTPTAGATSFDYSTGAPWPTTLPGTPG